MVRKSMNRLALAIAPELAWLATKLSRLHLFRVAAAILKLFVQAGVEDTALYYDLGANYYWLDTEKALYWFEKALDRGYAVEGNVEPLWKTVADIAILRGNLGRAEELISAEVSAGRVDSDLYSCQANLYYAKGQLKDSISAAKKAFELDSEDLANIIGVAAAYANAKQYGEAMVWVNKAVAKKPLNWTARRMRREIAAEMREEATQGT